MRRRGTIESSSNKESFDRISSYQESWNFRNWKLEIENNFSLVFKLKESENRNSTRIEKLYVGDGWWQLCREILALALAQLGSWSGMGYNCLPLNCMCCFYFYPMPISQILCNEYCLSFQMMYDIAHGKQSNVLLISVSEITQCCLVCRYGGDQLCQMKVQIHQEEIPPRRSELWQN